jgi:hypothetical protein
LREKARFDDAQVSTVGLSRCTLKKQSNSKACKASNGNPYPSRISVPIDVLGKGHRWPNAPRLDRTILANIAWKEIGG